MKLQNTYITVYEHNKFSYFLVPFDHDCSICLSFHTNPKITECGHIFCFTCLIDCIREFKYCPECNFIILRYYAMKWDFKEEIKLNDEIIMMKGDYSTIGMAKLEDRNLYPLYRKYYIGNHPMIDEISFKFVSETVINLSDNFKEKSRNEATEIISKRNLERRENDHKMKQIFYQSLDGQLCFMDRKGLEYIKKRFVTFDKVPEYVSCKVLGKKRRKRGKIENLKHLDEDVEIHILEVCFEIK